jgi:hypothetical protein
MMEMQGIKDTSHRRRSQSWTAGGLAVVCRVAVDWSGCVEESVDGLDGMYKGLWDVYTKLIRKRGCRIYRHSTCFDPCLSRQRMARFFGMEVARKLFSLI